METIKVRGYELTFKFPRAAKDFVKEYTTTKVEFYDLVCQYENSGMLKPSGIEFNDGWQIDGSYAAVAKEMQEQVR